MQGVGRKCHPSRPSIPEEREVNHLHVEAVKKRKEAAEAAADRKRRRKEKHGKACKIARTEGKPWPAMPQSMSELEEDASDAEARLPGEDEVAIGADSPPVYQEAGDEDAPAMLHEARPTSGLLVDPPLAGMERRSPTPVARRRSPTPAAGGRSSTSATERRSPLPATGGVGGTPAMSTGGDGSTASAETSAQTASRPQPALRVTPSNQASRGVGVPRVRRSGTGKRSMSARFG